MTKKVKFSFLILVWVLVMVQMKVNLTVKNDVANQKNKPIAVMKNLYENSKLSNYSQSANQNANRNGTQKLTVDNFDKGQSIDECMIDQESIEKTITAYVYLGVNTVDNPKTFLTDYAKRLGIKNGYEFDFTSGKEFVKDTLIKRGKEADTILSVVKLDEGEQYLSIDIFTKKEDFLLMHTYKKIYQMFADQKLHANVNLEISYQINERLADKTRSEYIDEILKSYDGKLVEAVETYDFCSTYGYVKSYPYFKNFSKNEKKTNIQIICSYDEKTNKTLIKIGMPFVNTSY